MVLFTDLKNSDTFSVSSSRASTDVAPDPKLTEEGSGSSAKFTHIANLNIPANEPHIKVTIVQRSCRMHQ